MRIHLIRTFHPHWGQHSGAHQFIQHINRQKFQIDVQTVEMGDGNFPITNRLVRNGIKFLVRRKGVRVYGLNDLLAEITAGRQWLRGQVDILHYLEGEHSLQFLPSLFRWLRAFRQPPPVAATFHQPPELLDSLINIDIVRLLDRVIVLSPEQHAYFVRWLPESQISMILHGIDVGYFHPPVRPQVRDGLCCISVGSWLRDYDTVLKVAEMLQGQSEFEFHIVSSAVSPPEHLTNVRVYSGIDDDALRSLYQASDVLFLPVTAATANNALLEGIACGLPIVTSDLASIRTYLPGQEAILVSENDPHLFAQALLKLRHDPELRAEMAIQARQRALALSWEIIAREHEALYNDLAAQAVENQLAGESACT